MNSGPYSGKSSDLNGQYIGSEVAMMRNLAREGVTAIDVGANIGDLSVPLAGVVGNKGPVLAIESHTEIFNVLRSNLALNYVRSVTPINAFVASSADVATGSSVWGEFAYVSQRWGTRFIALDALEVERCDLIKIDVDGKELEVLESGAMIIERFRPVLYFEDDVKDASPRLLDYAMNTLGYDLYRHPAPIWEAENFFGNPVNHWAPGNIVSLMVLGIPKELRAEVPNLRRITRPDEWWDGA
jgi:FkbM family methyltransferase